MPVNPRDIQTFIERHYHRIAGPDEIAEAYGVPLETLRKAFRQEAGMPLGDYIRWVRVARAQRLLAETNLQAGEVCRAVGWAREDTGERTFREVTGRTMQEYRQSVRGR